jgi:hypothetical protein
MRKAAAKSALQFALAGTLTPKEHVLIAEPTARCDFYELLRGSKKPCWFIRRGMQGSPLTEICASPRAAWKSAYDRLLLELRKAAA